MPLKTNSTKLYIHFCGAVISTNIHTCVCNHNKMTMDQGSKHVKRKASFFQSRETLRMYPVLPFLDRRCNAEYKLPNSDLVVEKGLPVYIPMFGLHFDEKYFPDPLKYKPERFENGTNVYNKDGIVFMPFGEGPRICIGERFGLLATS
ncbi:unnamed protein product [Acanthoscelides obtectus]|uniref:Cytochrome P450 n=1 Tax=Acanthoscelides obtectus TaxID=200917 RepID=A0A9P0Q7P1_ACAOB|nr:unnamed protein product [Acanthoscelides obtectus]CAK1659130.1 Probable cytochrome P450 6d5 [Acanthoscelides obtectus]